MPLANRHDTIAGRRHHSGDPHGILRPAPSDAQIAQREFAGASFSIEADTAYLRPVADTSRANMPTWPVDTIINI